MARYILRILIFNVVVIEFLNGIAGFYLNFFSIGKLIYTFIIGVLFVALITYHPRKMVVTMSFLFSAILLVGFRHFYDVVSAGNELNSYLRSGFLMCLVYEFVVVFKLYEKRDIARFLRAEVFTFYFISLSILLDRLYDFGGTFRFGSGALRDGNFSFFDSGNTLIALYILSYISTLLVSKGLFKIVVNFIVVFSVMLLTGSKVGIAGVGVLLVLKVISETRKKSKFIGNTLILSSLIVLVLVVWNLNLVLNYFITFLANYSSEGAKIEASNFDIVDILFSRRNIQLGNALIIISQSSIAELIFGLGLENAKLELGNLSLFEEATMVESDPVDILLAFGFVGLIQFFLLYVFRIKSLIKNGVKIIPLDNTQSGLLLMLLCLFLISAMSGHVFLNTATSIILGLLMAFTKKLESKEL
jgi:hypothetical protein